MNELLEEKFALEERLKKVNKQILRININNETQKLRDCLNISNIDFQKGLDYIYLANILGKHNHRGKGYMVLFDMALEKIGLIREYVENINCLYEEWLEWECFDDIEDEYNLANDIRRFGEPENEYIINRP